ncbi:MAG: hypothetical protein WB729_21455 [Candidatus Sulfotelmatobacter sp.]
MPRTLSFFAVALISTILLYAATGTISSFNPQGSTWADPTGINLGGVIAGNWIDSTGLRHGYLRSLSGTVAIVDEPDAGTLPNDGTWIFGINDVGQTTGSYSCTGSSGMIEPCGFVRDQYGNFTSFAAPGAVESWGQGINNAGVIAGGYSPNQGADIDGFIRDSSGNITNFAVSNARNTLVQNINASSQIVGTYTDDASFNSHGFIRSPTGNIVTFDAPGAIQTYAVAISNNGFVAGYHVDSSDPNAVRHGFYRDAQGNITSFDVPGAGTGETQGTLAMGINAAGTITGSYADSNSISHGFVRDQSGSFVTFDDPNAGTKANQGTYPCCINRLGQIAGEFSGNKGQVRSFIRQ